MSDERKNAMNALIQSKADEEKGEGSPRKQQQKNKRKVKGFLIGLDYIRTFDVLRAETGKPGPELAEEALRLLFEKYGKDLND